MEKIGMRSTLLVVLTLSLALGAPAARAQSSRYLDAGIPAASRQWTGADYERAVQILEAGKVSLPRFVDPQGADLLRRITSTENFALHRNKDLPLQARLLDYMKVYGGTATLAKLYYAEPAIGGVVPHQEIAALLAFLLQDAALGVELIDEFLPTLPKDDQYETRASALKAVHFDLTAVFVGVEATLADRQAFSADDLSALLKAREITLPRLKGAFSEEVRAELRKKLEADKARFTGQEDLQRLGAMIRELSV